MSAGARLRAFRFGETTTLAMRSQEAVPWVLYHRREGRPRSVPVHATGLERVPRHFTTLDILGSLPEILLTLDDQRVAYHLRVIAIFPDDAWDERALVAGIESELRRNQLRRFTERIAALNARLRFRYKVIFVLSEPPSEALRLLLQTDHVKLQCKLERDIEDAGVRRAVAITALSRFNWRGEPPARDAMSCVELGAARFHSSSGSDMFDAHSVLRNWYHDEHRVLVWSGAAQMESLQLVTDPLSRETQTVPIETVEVNDLDLSVEILNRSLLAVVVAEVLRLHRLADSIRDTVAPALQILSEIDESVTATDADADQRSVREALALIRTFVSDDSRRVSERLARATAKLTELRAVAARVADASPYEARATLNIIEDYVAQFIRNERSPPSSPRHFHEGSAPHRHYTHQRAPRPRRGFHSGNDSDSDSESLLATLARLPPAALTPWGATPAAPPTASAPIPRGVTFLAEDLTEAAAGEETF